ncbi:MAG: TRAP transporter substrate-binding protein DctP [Alphaproteobacteria bacterium]|nr:TRAP transporter substrate-binding protein DctP [Alphaproteobacteria bacterium]
MDWTTSRRALAAAFALAATTFLADAATAQAPIEWRFFTYFPVNDKPAQLNRAFAEDVLKATNGRLKITVFAAGELPYRAPDVVKAVATNQVQMGDVAVGFAAGDVPELNVFSMPFLCTSYDQFHRALPATAPVVDKVLLDRFKVRVAIHWTMPPQNLWLNRAVANLDEIKGLKVRTWNPEQVEMLRLLNAASVSITSAEVIPALERKVIDGAITSALSASDWKAFDIVKNGYMLNITMGHQVTMVNEEQLQKLPGDVRQALLAKAAEWGPRYRQMSESGDKEARGILAANGVALREPTAADMDRARTLMRPMWDSWAQKYGDVGRDLLAKSIAGCAG